MTKNINEQYGVASISASRIEGAGNVLEEDNEHNSSYKSGEYSPLFMPLSTIVGAEDDGSSIEEYAESVSHTQQPDELHLPKEMVLSSNAPQATYSLNDIIRTGDSYLVQCFFQYYFDLINDTDTALNVWGLIRTAFVEKNNLFIELAKLGNDVFTQEVVDGLIKVATEISSYVTIECQGTVIFDVLVDNSLYTVNQYGEKDNLLSAILQKNNSNLLEKFLEWINFLHEKKFLSSAELVELIRPRDGTNLLIEALKTENFYCLTIFLNFVETAFCAGDIDSNTARELFTADLNGASPIQVVRSSQGSFRERAFSLINEKTKTVFQLGCFSDLYENTERLTGKKRSFSTFDPHFNGSSAKSRKVDTAGRLPFFNRSKEVLTGEAIYAKSVLERVLSQEVTGSEVGDSVVSSVGSSFSRFGGKPS